MSNIVRFDAIRTIANGSITASYTALGVPFTHAMRVVQFINGTDADIMISFDGTTDNVAVLAGSFALYDLTSDQDQNEKFRYQSGTQLYIKYISALPTKNSVYVVCVYGKGE